MKNRMLAVLVVMLLGSGATAHAGLISVTLDVVGSNFSQQFPGSKPGSNIPFEPYMLNFTLTLDTSVDIFSATTDGLVINSFSAPFALSYTYSSSSDQLVLATTLITGGCLLDVSELCMFINDFSTAPNLTLLAQSTESGAFWEAGTFSATQVSPPNPVPVPATLLLLGLGLAGMGWSRRKRVLTPTSDQIC